MSELLELKPGSEMNLINSESVWNNISKHNRVLMMPVKEDCFIYKVEAAGKETENFYVAIKTDGKIITSHPYKRDMFEKSLFENAILKIIYDGGWDFIRNDEKSGDMFICLNMQLELI